jgi:high affinity sulfate transporter 1
VALVDARPSQFLPGIRVARRYRREWIRPDVVGGIVLVALLVPQGMAYAELAGVPPVNGLYASVLALLAYALVGPSRILILGPDSALSPMVFAAIVPLVASDAPPAQRITFAAMLAVIMGAICVAAGVSRLGVLADLLSMPMRIGYLNGLAVVVLVSQLPKLFGFSTDATGVVDEVRAFVDGVVDGRTNTESLVIGLACLAVIVGLRAIGPRIPGVLVAVVGATVAVTVFDLTSRGVAVVGAIPQGLPRLDWPGVGWSDAWALAVAAVGMAFITIADTVAMSRAFADRAEPVDADQEIAALGVANVAAGLFQGFPVSASSSRTAVAISAGARSQLTGVVGALGIVAMLVWFDDLTENLPTASLAAIVIAASFVLFDLGALNRLLRVRRSEFVLAALTAAGVVFVGVLAGIAIAAALSLGNFVRRAWRPYNVALGRIDGRKGYHDVARHPHAPQIPGQVLLRFDAPLFFANAEYFVDRVHELVDGRGEPVHRVIVAAEPISDIDTTAADALEVLIDDLHRNGIDLVFAELKGPVKDRLARYGLAEKIGDHGFPPTLGTAIDDYVAATGVDWVDWEDRRDQPDGA